jgi:hypothetical protein
LGDSAVVDAIVRQHSDNMEMLDVILDWPGIDLDFENINGFSPIHICDKVCQGLVTGRWLSLGTLVSSNNKTDCHDITEILFKVALKHHNHNQSFEFE